MKTAVDILHEVLSDIRPALQSHGGDIELVSYQDNKVTVRLSGACSGCPLSFYTLKMGVEEQIQQALPEVTEVIAVE